MMLIMNPGRAAEVAAGNQASGPGVDFTSVVDLDHGRLEWAYRGRKVLDYAFATNQFKPYVRELRTLDGVDLLRDAPSDHLHHHGLMYAIRINGVNFWEEVGKPGHERHAGFLSQGVRSEPGGAQAASFTELIHWVPEPDAVGPVSDAVAFLIERRTLTLRADEARRELSLEWRGEFEVGGRTNLVRIHGSEYNGLGFRAPEPWDRLAVHIHSGKVPYSKHGNPEAVPARWGAVSHAWDGHMGQIAMGAAAGMDGTPHVFAMTQPFTYLALTQGLDKAPLEYRAGDRFVVSYLVLINSQPRAIEDLEARYQAWSKAGTK